MAGIKINQYPLERLSFGDDDYYDIDYWTGSSYETAKIIGSTIKTAIQAGITGTSLYTDNGTLTADRTVEGANSELFFHEVGKFIVHSHKNNIDNDVFEVTSQASYKSFTVKDHNTGNDLFSIENGKVEISGAYYLPTTGRIGALNSCPLPSGVGIENNFVGCDVDPDHSRGSP